MVKLESDEPAQMPLTEKQPPVRLRPFAKVEVAVVEVTLSVFACNPPANVDEPYVCPTVI